MSITELKVLIKDMKRGKWDSPLRKVRVQGEPERPVIEGQCKEREVELAKEKEGKGDYLMHYDLRMLLELEVEGVRPEKDLLTQTEATLELNFIDHATIWRQMILRTIWKRLQMRRRMELKQKHFGMRRRTGLNHLCDKDYMSIGLTLL